LDPVYRIARKLFSIEDDLIEKANGWLLREAGKTDLARLEKFLLKHGRDIPRTTLRYAIEKFPEAKRIRILKATKV
jgi:3-methyladenine DNA glycosylase AlkD